MTTAAGMNKWQVYFKGNSAASLRLSFLNNLEYRLAKDSYSATPHDTFLASAYVATERLIERWIMTQQRYHKEMPKRVYYLSMEFLLGRSLANSLINLDIFDSCRQALSELGLDLNDILEREADAALGNGGLGRLAACFIDSMATLGIAAHGYCLRYEYGLFKQNIVDGRQIETPDNWLALPNPWEIARPEYLFKVHFGGRVEHHNPEGGRPHCHWVDTDEVQALPYDMPIPGYHTETVNTLRLWSAKAPDEFNLAYFNHGDYMQACEKEVLTENLTKVLYPNDDVFVGKTLRLKQEFFLVTASMQDIIRRFKSEERGWDDFAKQVAIQLNDTHPALAIPELLRILVDEEGLDFEQAFAIAVATFGYTNHTIMPEALEEWPVDMLAQLLPRHLELIYLINHNFLRDVALRYPGDTERLRRMSIIAEDGQKRVRMAHLAIVGAHRVNGVAALHSQLLRETILRDFYEMWPERFTNVTNGVTPRRWLRQANPELSNLITESLGEDWVRDLTHLKQLEPFADDRHFQESWATVKRHNKLRLAEIIKRDQGLEIDPDSIFDVQVKRIHEYKRQLLFALHIIHHYLQIKNNPQATFTPRTCIIGGKAAPGYHRAKLIIHLINNIAGMINNDPTVKELLKVVFLADYRVSLAERVVTAADISEQISMAGTEASGTGNMKLALNGALTVGTLDGANIEIAQEVGADNIFIFGQDAAGIQALKSQGYSPRRYIEESADLRAVLHLLECGFFSPGEAGLFDAITHDLVTYDPFCLLADFSSYVACQERVAATYRDRPTWWRMSILNVARSGKFSSDRAIRDYAREVWGVDCAER